MGGVFYTGSIYWTSCRLLVGAGHFATVFGAGQHPIFRTLEPLGRGGGAWLGGRGRAWRVGLDHA